MTRHALWAIALLVAACGGDDGGDDDGIDPVSDAGPVDAAVVPTFDECEGSDQSFVRNAILAGLGRHAFGQGEVEVYADLMAEVRALGEVPEGSDAGADPGAPDPRRVVVDAILRDPGYVDRWADHVMDALRVVRVEDQSQLSCYGIALRDRDDGALAAAVRDLPPTSSGDGAGDFTMLDLLRSALALDDLSPVYRGHLFALVSRPIPAANVPAIQAELARREDFGLAFDAAYLNRDLVCLGCHNSAGSITEHPDPALNRHWALPGRFEEAIWGDDLGVAPERAHAAFRYDGFVASRFAGDDGETQPWSWTASCGGFYPSGLPADPAGVDGVFAGMTGDRLTVYDLEASLAAGFDAIAAGGLDIAADGTIADPDAAFAYLVAASIVESVWREVIGTPLTIANYFPRNEASRDLLYELTESFVASRFSLRTLLADIMTTPYFNRLEPAAGCGAGPYEAPAVYDPWVIADDDPARRKNGPGDAVVALSGRTLLRAADAALGWREPFFQDFPQEPSSIEQCASFFSDCADMKSACEADGTCCYAHDYWCVYQPGPGEPTAGELGRFVRGIGVFLKGGERGFRGLDFQARLVFEDRFGTCRKRHPAPDFIDELRERAATTSGATVGDVVAALKDRLIGEPGVSADSVPGQVSEQEAIEAMLGASLSSPVGEVTDLDGKLRDLCGVLIATPQFLLSGLAAPDGDGEPTLTPPDQRYDAVCARVAERGLGELQIDCAGGALTVTD